MQTAWNWILSLILNTYKCYFLQKCGFAKPSGTNDCNMYFLDFSFFYFDLIWLRLISCFYACVFWIHVCEQYCVHYTLIHLSLKTTGVIFFMMMRQFSVITQSDMANKSWNFISQPYRAWLLRPANHEISYSFKYIKSI